MAKKVVKDLNYNQKAKLVRKITRAKKKGKLKRHHKDALQNVLDRKMKKKQDKMNEFIDDYEHARAHQEAEENAEFELMETEQEDVRPTEDPKKEISSDSDESSDDDALPLDMLDDDYDWGGGFIEKEPKQEIESDDEGEIRRFHTDLKEGEEALLPIKVDGKIIQRTRTFEVKDEVEDENEEKKGKKEDDFSHLSAAELMLKRKELLEAAKNTIAVLSLALTADPQKSISNLKQLLDFACGKKVHSLIKMSIQKLAIASLTKVFADIAPGYPIRERSEKELKQKMQKDTRALVNFESTLLSNYLKFLQTLEKQVHYFTNPKQRLFDENHEYFKLGIVAARAMGQLAVKLTHFNYATNVISCVIRLATSNYHPLVLEACDSLSTVLKEDLHFKISFHIVKTISGFLSKKSNCISPEILSIFLSLNVKEVDRGEAKKEKKTLEVKKSQLLKEKKSKTESKFIYQLKQMEHDLKKIEASETLSTKMKYGTETMKNLFLIYFKIIRKMSTTKLLGPVLEGLSKFAHLINIEFFDDLIGSLEELLEMQHLSIVDGLNSVKTVFTILSGEGMALNIDPFKFYKCVFTLIPAIPFEKDNEIRCREVQTLVDCVDLMLNKRKKQVSIGRVSAFVKRLLAISLVLPSNQSAAILACLRCLFLNHSGLSRLIEDDSDVIMNGIYRPDNSDPDTCNALASSALPEFQKLLKYPDNVIARFTDNILNGCPSSGPKRLPPEWVTMFPRDWITSGLLKSNKSSPFLDQISKVAGKRKIAFSSKTLCSTIEFWLKG